MNEREAIAKIAKILKLRKECFESDACYYEGFLYNIDGYSASESLLPWMNLEDWGWKAVVAASSDIVASGGRPLALLYSVGVGEAEEGIDIAVGVGEAASWINVPVLGGDFNRCNKDKWIDVAMIGKGGNVWLRWNTATEDLRVIQVGYLGYGFIAYLILKGVLDIKDVPSIVIEYTKRPTPPIKELAQGLEKCKARAAIDNSDGWAWSLSVVANYSNVGISINEIIVPEDIIEIVRKLNVDRKRLMNLLLNSAEDYNYAIFADNESAECLINFLEKNKVPAGIVGFTYRGSGVKFSGKEIEITSWDSFSS